MYQAMIMFIINSLMNPFHIENKIKVNNSNLVQHENSKNYITLMINSCINVHGV